MYVFFTAISQFRDGVAGAEAEELVCNERLVAIVRSTDRSLVARLSEKHVDLRGRGAYPARGPGNLKLLPFAAFGRRRMRIGRFR